MIEDSVSAREGRQWPADLVALLGSGLATRANELLWSDGLDYTRYLGSSASGVPTWSSAGAGPVPLGSTGESIIPIGTGGATAPEIAR